MAAFLRRAILRLSVGALLAAAVAPAFSQPAAASAAAVPTVGSKVARAGWKVAHPGAQAATRVPAPSTSTLQPRIATTPQLIQNSGFESGPASWIQSSYTNGVAAGRTLIDSSAPHTGTSSANLCQAVQGCDDAVYQAISVPNRVLSATLSYWFLLGSQDSPASCADELGVGLTDVNFNSTTNSGYNYCSDWSGQPWTQATIDETSFLQGQQGGTAYVVAVGTADNDLNGGWSDYHVDDFSLTITYANGTSEPYTAVSNAQYRLSNSDGVTWHAIDSTFLTLTVTPAFDSNAIVSGNADLWTANAGVNQDIGIAVSGGSSPSYPTATGQPEAWKESGGFAGTFSPNAAYVQTVLSFKANTTYHLSLVWKANHVTGGTIFAAAGLGPVFSPTRLTVQLVPTGGLASAQGGFSQGQFRMNGSNGTTWTALSTPATSASSGMNQAPTLTVTPTVNGEVIIGGNADLWTANAGVNQDIGITANGGSFTANQILAWKESGGFAGTFSPNAAFVQAVVPVTASTTYTFGLAWKANHSTAGSIFAGAGPINGNFSPTTLSAQFVPFAAGVQDAVSNNQYQLTGSDGVGWYDIDSTNLSLTITPPADCVAVLSGNADLWTVNAGYNQDIGIQLSWPGTTLGPDVIGWKESGGFAGTFSPNAAFVQTVVPVFAGTTYTAKLQWKTNKPSPSNDIIEAAAGTASTGFSPTRLTAQLLCPQKLVFTAGSQTLTAGQTSAPVTAELQDAWGNIVNAPSAGIPVTLSSTSDTTTFMPSSSATIAGGFPTTSSFTYSDTTAGTPTISATATGVTSASQQETINPGPAQTFSLTTPGTVTHGTAFNVTVTARDQYGNIATGYLGTVHFTSSDGAAVLPADYSFQAGDNGTHTFSVTLNTAGSQTVTATDKVTATITGTATLNVQ